MADLTQLDPEVLQELGEYVWNKYEEYKGSKKRDEVKERIQKSRKAYDQETDPVSFLWEAAINIRIPLTTISVDQLEPRLVAQITGRKDVIFVDDIGTMDAEVAERVRELDNAILAKDVKVKEVCKRQVHDILVDGQDYEQVFWQFKEGKTRAFAEYPEEMGQGRIPSEAYERSPELQGALGEGLVPQRGFMMQETTETTHDGPTTRKVDLEDLYFPDRVDDWEEVPVVREYYLSWGEYNQNLNGATGWLDKDEEELDQLKSLLKVKREEKGSELVDQDTEEKQPDRDSEKQQLKAELFCLEGHFPYDVDDDGVEENLIVTIEGTKKPSGDTTVSVLYVQDNADLDPRNRKQIQPLWLMREPNTAYGYPIHHKIKELENGASDVYVILVNSALIQMNPWLFYSKDVGLETADVDLHPGAMIPCADPSKIVVPNVSTNASQFQFIIDFFISLWERIIAISDFNMGRQSEVGDKGNTARGTSMLLQEAMVTHDYLGSSLVDCYTRIFEIIHDLVYLNLSPEKEAQLVGQEPVPRVLSVNYKIRIASSTKAANREVARLETMDALPIAEKGVELGVVDPAVVIEDALNTFGEVNVDKWMSGPLAMLSKRAREDPMFMQIVMGLLQQPPEQLMETVKSLQIGEQFRQEVSEEIEAQTGMRPEEMGPQGGM